MSLFPPPPPGYTGSGTIEYTPRRKARSLSPPGNRTRQSWFSCLRSDGDELARDVDGDDEADFAELPVLKPRLNCPIIPGFREKVLPLKQGLAMASPRALRGNDELYANLKIFLGEEMAMENLECWEAFALISANCTEGDLEGARHQLTTVYKEFFAPDATNPVGFSELSEPLAVVAQQADTISLEELTSQAAFLLDSLEYYALRDPLIRWHDYQLRGNTVVV